MKKTLSFITILLMAAAALFLSCEPADWEYIIAAPEAVESVTVQDGTFTLDGDEVYMPVVVGLPEFDLLNLYTENGVGIVLLFYIRQETRPAAENSFVDARSVGTEEGSDPVEYGQENEFTITVTAADVINGETYVITTYTQDPENQLSDPTESDPFVLSW